MTKEKDIDFVNNVKWLNYVHAIINPIQDERDIYSPPEELSTPSGLILKRSDLENHKGIAWNDGEMILVLSSDTGGRRDVIYISPADDHPDGQKIIKKELEINGQIVDLISTLPSFPDRMKLQLEYTRTIRTDDTDGFREIHGNSFFRGMPINFSDPDNSEVTFLSGRILQDLYLRLE